MCCARQFAKAPLRRIASILTGSELLLLFSGLPPFEPWNPINRGLSIPLFGSFILRTASSFKSSSAKVSLIHQLKSLSRVLSALSPITCQYCTSVPSLWVLVCRWDIQRDKAASKTFESVFHSLFFLLYSTINLIIPFGVCVSEDFVP